MDMQHRSKPAGTQLSSMQGGSGEDSYANSSSPQNFVFRVYTRAHLSEALDHLCRSPHILEALQIVGDTAATISTCTGEGAATNTAHVNSNWIPRLAIADLGCSHGPNTLDHAQFILQGLQTRLCNTKLGSSSIEMQYLFSDLPGNNFNSLFQSLQGFLEKLGCHGMDPSSCKIFTGAVAGSFHGALFPTGTLHFALSAYSLHWLSQVPPEVLDRSSSAWNGGSIWLHGKRPKVIEAFASQFQKDLRAFFQNRARELVKGGVIFLLFPSRTELHPAEAFYDPRLDLWSDYFDSTWTELVSEGLISKEERDMFNLPFYMCHENELRQVLEEFVGVLEIIKMELMNNCFGMPNEDEQKLLEDPQVYGQFWSSFIASLLRPMVESHLGEARTIELFKTLATHIRKRTREATLRKNSLLVAIIQRL